MIKPLTRNIQPKDQLEKERLLTEAVEKLTDEMVDMNPGKSAYFLQNFIVNQQDTVPARKRMALQELQIRINMIRRAQVAYHINEANIHRLASECHMEQDNTKSFTEEYEYTKKRGELEYLFIAQEELEMARIGALREAEALYKIATQYPKFTAEEYEADEVNYWMLRLGRQVMLDLKTTGVPSASNVDAIRMMEVPQNDDFASWLKSFSDPLNSPQDFIKGVIMARMQKAAERTPLQPGYRSGDGDPQPGAKETGKIKVKVDRKVAFSKEKPHEKR